MLRLRRLPYEGRLRSQTARSGLHEGQIFSTFDESLPRSAKMRSNGRTESPLDWFVFQLLNFLDEIGLVPA